MSTPDPDLSRRDAERLLDAPAQHDSVLGWALTAATAPAHPSELRGEDAAAAAFRAARVSPAPASRSGFVSPRRLGSRAAARAVVATGAVVALTSGGFALASSTDLPGLSGLPGLPDLPALPGQASDRATESVADGPGAGAGSVTSSSTHTTGGPSSGTRSPGASGPTSASASTDAPGTPSSTSPSDAPSETPSGTTDAPTTPSPDFEGLCRAFQAIDRTDAGTSLDSAAFLALATEAGGADRIATYCIDLIGPPKQTGKPTPSPGKPTAQPTNDNQGNQGSQDDSGNGNQGNQGNQNGSGNGSQSSGGPSTGSTHQPNPNSQTNNGNGNGPGRSGNPSNPAPVPATAAAPSSLASPAASPTSTGSSGDPGKKGGTQTSG